MNVGSPNSADSFMNPWAETGFGGPDRVRLVRHASGNITIAVYIGATLRVSMNTAQDGSGTIGFCSQSNLAEPQNSQTGAVTSAFSVKTGGVNAIQGRTRATRIIRYQRRLPFGL